MTDNKPLHPAATILLLRDNPTHAERPLEVMMVKRHHEIDFASGALVFPGGKLSDGDYDVPEDRIRSNTSLPDTLVTFALGALRECFEECGILLAYDATTGEIVSGERATALTPYRSMLDRSEISLGEFATRENLVLALDRLVHFAHWIGPKIAPKRFDTHFFLAKAPDRQLAIHDGREAVDSLWISPVDALSGQREGKHTIIFPTRCNIDKLGESASTEAALSNAVGASIIPVEPWLEERDGGSFLCIPEEAGYSTTAESIETAFR